MIVTRKTIYRVSAYAAVSGGLLFALVGCETSNFAPAVTAQMTSSNAAEKKTAQIGLLDKGRALFVHRCIECHTLPIVWHYSVSDWDDIVDSMADRSNLKPAERDAILAYIRAVRRQR